MSIPLIRNALALVIVHGLAGSLPVSGGTIADTAAAVETAIAADDFATALVGAQDLLGQVWTATTGIGFGDTLLVEQPSTGFGLYNPRLTEVFKPGEPVILYAEPFGFGYGTPDAGLYSIGFFVDLVVRNAAGEVLADIPGLTDLKLTSRHQNREFPANITYNLSGLAAGKYVLMTTLRDKNSEKSGAFEVTIEIVE